MAKKVLVSKRDLLLLDKNIISTIIVIVLFSGEFFERFLSKIVLNEEFVNWSDYNIFQLTKVKNSGNKTYIRLNIRYFINNL